MVLGVVYQLLGQLRGNDAFRTDSGLGSAHAEGGGCPIRMNFNTGTTVLWKVELARLHVVSGVVVDDACGLARRPEYSSESGFLL